MKLTEEQERLRVQMNMRGQNAKEEYLCLSAFITGMCLGVLIVKWPDISIVVRGIFIFFSCTLAFMTYAFKTAKVTSFILGKDVTTNQNDSEHKQ